MKQWLKKKVEAFMEYQQRRADYMVLHRMSDAELRDIGIARGDIKYVCFYK